MAAKPKKTGKQFEKTGVDDLVMLPKIAEDSILENLKKRYMNNLIYTNVGPVLIAVNPFKDLGVTGNEYIEMYKGRFRHELDPHIYALAEETYRAMKGEQLNQCVIISGESGAGKTESAKLVMKYISAVSGNSAGVEYVKHVILESNPLLEAFGNAKTLRNNNSSRFGKYFEIQFNAAGDPCGGSITNYLLEKSRVVFQTRGERSFHIFYNLLAGASDAEANALSLYSADNFNYLNQSACYTVDGMDDAQDYRDVRNAMNVIGIPGHEQETIFRLVAGILHMGNIYFTEGGKGDASIADSRLLDLAASMFGIQPFNLQKVILQRLINTGQAGGRMSTYNVPQNVEQATYARDAISKAIYSRVFDYLIASVNRALARDNMPHKTVIAVLDIFGFEIFEHNGFEQFCINYVNEKLQQFFIELTLKAEQEEYQREGIKWEPIKFFNNQIVCDLIEGKAPPGIFSVLDDICYTIHAQSKGTDEKFLQKCQGAFSSHLHFRGFDSAFQIKHYAGDVTYDADGFSDKNKDTLFNDVIQAIQESQNPFLVSLFPEDTKDTASNRKRPTTAGFKIKSSAQALMKSLSACEPHYIRCIKPNETKQALDWDHPRVKHQVQYLGLLENVRVRRAGFAYRAEFARFLKRYKKLSKKTWSMRGEWGGSPQDGCTTLLQDIGIEAGQWQLGKTKVFIRHPETLFHIEELLERHDYDCCVKIQRSWKKWKARKVALEQKSAIADLMRGKKERMRDSVNRSFDSDYIRYEDNYSIQEQVQKGETFVFADQILKLNRRSKPERRDLVLTNRALYIIQRKKKKQQVVYQLSRRTDISQIQSISLSTLADNYIVIHSPNEYDNLFENEHKTELAIKIVGLCKEQSGRDIPLNFSDSINYKIKTKDTRMVKFQSNPGAAAGNMLKKSGKSLIVHVPPGLPRDTDTKPKSFANRGANQRVYTPPAHVPSASSSYSSSSSSSSSSSAPPRGGFGGGGARGGSSAAPPGRVAPPSSMGGGASASPRFGAPPSSGGGGAAPPPSFTPPSGGIGGAPRGGSSAGSTRGGARGGATASPPPSSFTPPSGGIGGAPRGGASAGGARGGARGGAAAPPAPRVSTPPPKPSKPQAKALYDYTAQNPDELNFKEGDILSIISKDAGGWWNAELRGTAGWIPANYVEEL